MTDGAPPMIALAFYAGGVVANLPPAIDAWVARASSPLTFFLMTAGWPVMLAFHIVQGPRRP